MPLSPASSLQKSRKNNSRLPLELCICTTTLMCQLGTMYQGGDAPRARPTNHPLHHSKGGSSRDCYLEWASPNLSDPDLPANIGHRRTLQGSKQTSSEGVQEQSANILLSLECGWAFVWQAGPSSCPSSSFARLLLHGVKSPVHRSPAHGERSHSHSLLRHSPSAGLSVGSRRLLVEVSLGSGEAAASKAKGILAWKQVPGWGRKDVYEEQSWTTALVELEIL